MGYGTGLVVWFGGELGGCFGVLFGLAEEDNTLISRNSLNKYHKFVICLWLQPGKLATREEKQGRILTSNDCFNRYFY